MAPALDLTLLLTDIVLTPFRNGNVTAGCSWLVSFAIAEKCNALDEMKILTRSNRIYDTTRFGQPEIRVRHRQEVPLLRAAVRLLL
jgi:hypothetical protein